MKILKIHFEMPPYQGRWQPPIDFEMAKGAPLPHALPFDPGEEDRVWREIERQQREHDPQGMKGYQPQYAVVWNTLTRGKFPGATSRSGLKAVETAVEDVVKAVESIPIVGDAINIAVEIATAPARIALNIASGARLDHVVMGALKDQLKIIKDAAPFAQAVMTFVPGIGTGVAAAVGAGVALAEGKSIDQAVIAGVRGALPGGQLAAAGFDAATKVARGENVGKAALESARNLVPPGPAQKAFDVGVAVATGEKIQTALARGLAELAPGQVQALVAAGDKALATTPGLASAIKLVPPGAATDGFKLGAGLLGQKGMNEKALVAVRAKLAPEKRKGFDLALKTQERHVAWLKNVTGPPVQPQLAAASKAPARPLPALRTAPPPPKLVVSSRVATAPPPKPAPTRAPTPAAPPPRVAAAPTPTAPRRVMPTEPAYTPYPSGALGDLDAPLHPHGGHPHPQPHHFGHQPMHFGRPMRPFARGGGGTRWPGWWGGWGVPWSPEVVTTTEVCRTWGDPIEMPPAMQTAAKAALGASRGRPTTVRGPDNVLYLFSIEGGGQTARPCAAVATA